MALTYSGGLDTHKWIALAESTQNNGQPCLSRSSSVQHRLHLSYPITSAETVLSYTFSLNVPMAILDKVSLVLPMFRFSAMLATPAMQGCGASTFSVSHTDSGIMCTQTRFLPRMLVLAVLHMTQLLKLPKRSPSLPLPKHIDSCRL